jgi:hypothetical protein
VAFGQGEELVSHVVLLGDSTFDNARYVPGGPSVIDQLRGQLPDGWRATLLAADGAVARDVRRQLARLPAGATHLVVSVGWNNALEKSVLLEEPVVSVEEGFLRLAEVQEQFRQEYRDLLRSVFAAGKAAALCTVSDAVPGLTPPAVTALSVFNDVILREGFQVGAPILDLRLLCDEARDYSVLSPIAPSQWGGAKIVQGVLRIVTGHDFGRAESVVYGK